MKSTKNKLIEGLLNVTGNEKLYSSFTQLQNEIGVGFNMGVIAIASVNSDSVAAAFAKGFADTFVKNNSSCLIIDANMYNPSLKKHLGESDVSVVDNAGLASSELVELSKQLSVSYFSKEVYPSEVFKSGLIQKNIKEVGSKFEHVIVLVPSIKDHKEIALLKDVIESIILVSQRNVTTKEDIYNSAAFLVNESLPLAKTVVLK